jgi:SAM-dependent methyltransferase
VILDIYDPVEMTEPSIGIARRLAPSVPPAVPADWRRLPLDDAAFDAAFLIFAAHELRRSAARASLFREIARALRPGGVLAIVEHTRDCANFIAFGPGFLHFLPRRAWSDAPATAGLRLRTQAAITPFVRVFLLEKPE